MNVNEIAAKIGYYFDKLCRSFFWGRVGQQMMEGADMLHKTGLIPKDSPKGQIVFNLNRATKEGKPLLYGKEEYM